MAKISLIKLWTKEEHQKILGTFLNNTDAAIAYNNKFRKGDVLVSRQLVRYWRSIFMDNGSSTHSQDQAITPVSFRVTKIRPSTEQIPIFIITSVLFRTTNPTTGSIHEHGDDLWASICNHHTP